MAEPMSDEELYQLTGSWEAAAALRDQQRAQSAPVVSGGIANLIAAPADNISNAYVKPNIAPTSGGVSNVIEGDDIDTQIAQLPEEYASWRPSSVPGYYDLVRKDDGAVLDREIQNTFSDFDLLKMGLSFIPGMQPIVAGLNVADAVRTGDLTKAAIGATGLVPGMQNLNTALRVGQAVDQGNLVNVASALAGNSDFKNLTGFDTSVGNVNLNDALKYANTAAGVASGNPLSIFNAVKGLAGDQNANTKSSLAGFEANPEDFIEGYFQPGGEGYLDLGGQDMTVREDPENLDALLRSLSPYAVDGGTSVFAQGDDIPELETVSNRPITSLDSIFGNTDILQTLPKDDIPELNITGGRLQTDVPEMTITDSRPVSESNSLRTKDIVSDIPDEIITADQIDKLFPDFDFNQILQTVTPPGAKVATPAKPAAPGTKTTQQALADLGLNMQQAPSQDPYADIKLMQELFGQDIAYKLLSLGGDKRK